MAPTVAEYYAGKNIFITGATGFMGKVLVEKILRSCPDVEKIYMMLRPKRGQGLKERLDEFISCRVFEKLRSKNPMFYEKLHVVPGDILIEDLGISVKDRQTIQEECQIVFHCAACVRFDMPLRDAVNMNTVGTKRALALAEHMKKLEVFLHVSTAYCRCELPILEEKIYPSKHRPDDIMQCCRWMDDDLIQQIEPKLLNPQPNTYAYTKSLTEDLVSQYQGKFPIAIARPSIVTASLKEPVPGWVDNINGPTGIMIGACKGVIRTMMCDPNIEVDVIPVDLAVNACIVLAYETGVDKAKDIRICNMTQSGVNPMTWGESVKLGRQCVKETPFSIMLWVPGGSEKTSWLMHHIALLFLHWLPALFIDFLLLLLGQKTFMIKVQKKVNYGLGVLQYYTTKPWYFKNDNYISMRKRLTEKDNQIFFTDIEELKWIDYMKNYILGCREYCLKEDPSTIPMARKRYMMFYYLDLFVKFIFYALCVYFMYRCAAVIVSLIN